MKSLAKPLNTHFGNWEQKRADKGNHPLFFVCSGAGTGKSRLLDELPRLALEAVADNEALRAKVQQAYVFNVTFENGTSTDDFDSPDFAIGTRMLWQMARQDGDTWSKFYNDPTYRVSVGKALDLLAKAVKKPLQELTVFLLVDGLQKLEHSPQNRDSKFSRAMQTVASLVNASGGPFVIGCCAATVYAPVADVLHTSPQWREYLTPPPLNGRAVLESKDPVVGVLVDDMGGHGRALEALAEALRNAGNGDVADYGFSKLAHDVRAYLQQKYPDWKDHAAQYRPLLVAVLTRHRVPREGLLPGTTWKVDDVVSLGMFRYTEALQVLECPYIWLWIMAGWTSDAALKDFRFATYDEQQRQCDPTAPLGVQCWQHWEEFNVTFRCLKTVLFDGQDVSLLQLHAGARLDSATNAAPPIVHVQMLEAVQASSQYPTASNATAEVKHEHGTIKMADARHMVLNGGSAPAGDAFLGLHIDTPSKVIHEVQQYKLIKEAVTQKMFDAELIKSVNPGVDLFLLFTAKESKIQVLPPRSGIVDASNFRDYYGPFAGRAFIALRSYKPDINTAPRSHLEAVKGVGPVTAENILIKRKEAPFSGPEDACKRAKVPLKVANAFAFQQHLEEKAGDHAK